MEREGREKESERGIKMEIKNERESEREIERGGGRERDG